MRRLVPFLAFLPLVAVAACTTLLGDFTVGPAEGPGQGMDSGGTSDGNAILPDGARADGGGMGDGSVGPDGTVDAPAPPPPALTCGEQQGSRTKLNNSPDGGAAEWDTVAIVSNATVGTRVITFESNHVHAFTIPNHNNNPVDVPISLGGGGFGGRPLDIERYADGFAVLVLDSNAANQPFFGVYQIADTESAWEPEEAVGLPGDVPMGNNMSAVFALMDPSTGGGYFLAVYDSEAGKDVLYVQREMAGNPQLLAIGGTFASGAYGIGSPGIAFDNTDAYILLNSNGPNSGGSAIVTVPVVNITDAGTVEVLVPPTLDGGLLQGIGLTNSTLNMGSANIAFLEADLNTLTANYGVGQVPTTSLPTLQLASLPSSTTGAVPDGGDGLSYLLVDKAQGHWEAPAGEALLMTARTFSQTPATTGLNFAWWDAKTGALRGSALAENRLLPDVQNLYRSSATFTTPAPTQAIAFLAVVYEVETMSSGGGQSPGDLWVTSILCSK